MELKVYNCECELEGIKKPDGSLPELNAIVRKRYDLTKELMVLDIVPDGWELPEFIPGQYISLGLPDSAAGINFSGLNLLPVARKNKIIKRAYSIASGSVSRESVEIYVRLVNGGALTPRLFNLKPGDRLWLSNRIKGKFTLDHVPPNKNILLVARGTGLAPYMSMLRTIVLKDENRKIAVIHSVRHSFDLGYRKELELLEKNNDNFSYFPVLSRPFNEEKEWVGLTGYIQKIWNDNVVQERWMTDITPENTNVYLCGHPNMINDMTEVLKEEGFTIHTNRNAGTIHLEKYW